MVAAGGGVVTGGRLGAGCTCGRVACDFGVTIVLAVALPGATTGAVAPGVAAAGAGAVGAIGRAGAVGAAAGTPTAGAGDLAMTGWAGALALSTARPSIFATVRCGTSPDSSGNGSTAHDWQAAGPRRDSKCRCGALLEPVEPTSPMT